MANENPTIERNDDLGSLPTPEHVIGKPKLPVAAFMAEFMERLKETSTPVLAILENLDAMGELGQQLAQIPCIQDLKQLARAQGNWAKIEWSTSADNENSARPVAIQANAGSITITKGKKNAKAQNDSTTITIQHNGDVKIEREVTSLETERRSRWTEEYTDPNMNGERVLHTTIKEIDDPLHHEAHITHNATAQYNAQIDEVRNLLSSYSRQKVTSDVRLP